MTSSRVAVLIKGLHVQSVQACCTGCTAQGRHVCGKKYNLGQLQDMTPMTASNQCVVSLKCE